MIEAQASLKQCRMGATLLCSTMQIAHHQRLSQPKAIQHNKGFLVQHNPGSVQVMIEQVPRSAS